MQGTYGMHGCWFRSLVGRQARPSNPDAAISHRNVHSFAGPTTPHASSSALAPTSTAPTHYDRPPRATATRAFSAHPRPTCSSWPCDFLSPGCHHHRSKGPFTCRRACLPFFHSQPRSFPILQLVAAQHPHSAQLTCCNHTPELDAILPRPPSLRTPDAHHLPDSDHRTHTHQHQPSRIRIDWRPRLAIREPPTEGQRRVRRPAAGRGSYYARPSHHEQRFWRSSRITRRREQEAQP